MEYQHITHPFSPVYDSSSEILILGSLPSVKSRENEFYYGHPQNRFWRVMAAIFEAQFPNTVEEKKELLLAHKIALWDVVQNCDIRGSSDSSIRNVYPTDLHIILKHAKIRMICANGKTAASLYQKYQASTAGMNITALPSTSPANAGWTFERLCEAWRIIK
jgi:hypoxanthine-DNA glycosylase